jgi:NitT/TauT family transport system substrate-binding protein
MRATVLLASLAIVPGLAMSSAGAQSMTKVTIVQQHPIVSVGEEVFFYAVPKRLGYFRDEHLDVALQSVANASVAAQVMQSGSAEFATTQPEAILKLREGDGNPIGIYALRHGNGSKVAVLPDSPVQQLQDFRGKRLGGLSWAAGGAPVLMRMLSDVGVGPNDYQRVTVGAGAAAATALINKQIDGLVLWDSIFASFEDQGMTFRYIDMPLQRSMGALTIATTERYAKDHSDQVTGFCRAVSKGLYFTRTNPAAAIALFLEEFPSLKTPNVDPSKVIADDVHVLEAWLDAALWDVPYGTPAGIIPDGTWQASQRFYVAAGTLQGTAAATDGYTNRFLKDCNSFDADDVAKAARSFNSALH